MNIQPLANRVIVEPHEFPGITASGIHLPDSYKDPFQSGIVRAAGRGPLMAGIGITEMEIGEGDIVLFPTGSGKPMAFEGKPYLVMYDHEISAKVKEKEDGAASAIIHDIKESFEKAKND